MQSSAVVSLEPHRGTGRAATIVQVAALGTAPPTGLADGNSFILVLLSEKPSAFFTVELARAWLNAGASYICAWGPGAAQIEETFDYAAFLPEFGEPVPFTVMTTAHADEPLEEALWFAFYSAQPPEDLRSQLNHVVMLVDGEHLKSQCAQWTATNIE